MPHEETLTFLEHIRDAAEFILELSGPMSFSDYRSDRVRRNAIERNFITLGETTVRIARADPEIAKVIEQFPRVIAFRNRVVHGYDQLDDAIVWAIIEKELPAMLAKVRTLLQESEKNQ